MILVALGLGACSPETETPLVERQTINDRVEPIPKGAQLVFSTRAYLVKQREDVDVLQPFELSDKGQSHVVPATQAHAIAAGLSASPYVDLFTEGNSTLVTRDGQSGKVEAVRELIYPVEYDPPEVSDTAPGNGFNGGVTPAHPVTFETLDCGLKQEFTPIVAADGTIDVTLEIESRTLDGFINYGSPIHTTGKNWLGATVQVVLTENRIEMPVFTTGKMVVHVSLRPGQTILTTGIPSGRALPVELREAPEEHGTLSGTEARKPYELVLLTEVTVSGGG